VHPEYLRISGLERELTMVYLDPVGSGDSDLLPDGDYSMSRYARFAEAVLDDIGAPAAYFLGHSHGGFVALQFGLDAPDRLDGLILYDTAPVYGPELVESVTKEMAAFVQRWPDRPEAAEAGRMWEAANVTRTLKISDDESRQRFLRGILPAYFADYRRTIERIGEFLPRATHDPNRLQAGWDVRDRLGTISAPALVIVGTHDHICPPRFAYEIQTGIPGARLCELRRSGHFGHMEEADEFAAAVLDFVHNRETGNRA
jgi:proline iminopeptidase